MKNKQIIIVVFIAIAIIVPSIALAQVTTDNTMTNNSVGEVSTDGVIITQASPIFFLKRALENVRTFFTFGKEKLIQRHLELANRRLSEAKKLSEEGNEKALDAINMYKDEMKKTEEDAKDIDKEDLITKITEATNRHINTLEGVLEKVPDTAKDSIEKNIEKAKERQTLLIDRIKLIQKNALEGIKGNSTGTMNMGNDSDLKMRIRPKKVATNTMLFDSNDYDPQMRIRPRKTATNTMLFDSNDYDLKRGMGPAKTATRTRLFDPMENALENANDDSNLRRMIGYPKKIATNTMLFDSLKSSIEDTNTDSTGSTLFESIRRAMGYPQKHTNQTRK